MDGWMDSSYIGSSSSSSSSSSSTHLCSHVSHGVVGQVQGCEGHVFFEGSAQGGRTVTPIRHRQVNTKAKAKASRPKHHHQGNAVTPKHQGMR